MAQSRSRQRVGRQATFSGIMSFSMARKRSGEANLNRLDPLVDQAALEMSGSQSVSSGAKISKLVVQFERRLGDYATVCFMIFVVGLAQLIPVRQAFLLFDKVAGVSYPFYEKNSVPSWAVPVLALIPALLVFLCYKLYAKCTWRVFERLVMGLVFTFLATLMITELLKNYVGRYRPDFYGRCWPNGNATYLSATLHGGWPDCYGAPSTVKEGRKSFPSGHSSLTATGCGYLAWFLLGQLMPLSPSCSGTYLYVRLFIALLPLSCPVAVGISRITDYWHHPSDVLTGWAIGLLVAWLTYRSLYPNFTVRNCNVMLLDMDSASLSGRKEYLASPETIPMSTSARGEQMA